MKNTKFTGIDGIPYQVREVVYEYGGSGIVSSREVDLIECELSFQRNTGYAGYAVYATYAKATTSSEAARQAFVKALKDENVYVVAEEWKETPR